MALLDAPGATPSAAFGGDASFTIDKGDAAKFVAMANDIKDEVATAGESFSSNSAIAQKSLALKNLIQRENIESLKDGVTSENSAATQGYLRSISNLTENELLRAPAGGGNTKNIERLMDSLIENVAPVVEEKLAAKAAPIKSAEGPATSEKAAGSTDATAAPSKSGDAAPADKVTAALNEAKAADTNAEMSDALGDAIKALADKLSGKAPGAEAGAAPGGGAEAEPAKEAPSADGPGGMASPTPIGGSAAIDDATLAGLLDLLAMFDELRTKLTDGQSQTADDRGDVRGVLEQIGAIIEKLKDALDPASESGRSVSGNELSRILQDLPPMLKDAGKILGQDGERAMMMQTIGALEAMNAI